MSGRREVDDRLVVSVAQAGVNSVILTVCKRMGFAPFPCRVELTRKHVLGMAVMRTVTRSRTDFTPIGREHVVLVNKAEFVKADEALRLEIVAHEACHAIVSEYVRSPSGDHGPAWQAAMRLCGLDPRATYRHGKR